MAETYIEEIFSVHVSLIKYFAIVLGKRSGYTRGIGLKGGVSSSHDKLRLHVEKKATLIHTNMLEQEFERPRIELEAQHKEMEVQHEDM